MPAMTWYHDGHYKRFDIKKRKHARKNRTTRFCVLKLSLAQSHFTKWLPPPCLLSDGPPSLMAKLAPRPSQAAAFCLVQHIGAISLDDTRNYGLSTPRCFIFRACAPKGTIRKNLIKNRNYLMLIIGYRNIFTPQHSNYLYFVLRKTGS